ncbi:MAG: serine/threonine-protein kinase [Planctomycetaceae bacterium]
MNEHTFVPKVNPLRSIRDIFLAARALPAGEERDRYLKTAVGDDPGLRQRVERMLASLQDAEPNPLVQAMESLNMDAPGETECLAIDVSQHPTIGPYKLLERLGTGGMGEVFVAEQRQPVRRNVALKLIKRGMDSREVVARFEAERQALAMMSHPNIASVLDAGQTEEGRPYFVMDLVRGIRITHYCDQHKLDLRQRLELMVTVCQAVQHAHHKGIIHRDLKPGNILVELDDVRHVPKVIDFGVAKATNQRLTERTLFTQFSQMIGTPLYMSPEQAQMTSMDVDTRSDVYSLGVVLYELLTGSTPFDRATLNKAGYDEMRRIIQEDEPPRPSQRISTLKAERLSTLTEQQQKATPQLERQVERELDWIVMKSLEKDRIRRYESASALAADLQRYLNGDLVQACPPSVGYRFRKYFAKHKLMLTTSAILASVLITSTIISWGFAVHANQAQITSTKSAADALDAKLAAEDEKKKAIVAQKAAVTAQKMSDVNLAAALDAVAKLLEHASNPELLEVPRAQPILKNIVTDALAFYDNLEVSKAESPEVRFQAAMTRVRLAQLAGHFEENELSRRAYLDAIAEFERLGKHFPNDHRYGIQQARETSMLGWLYVHNFHDFSAAESCFEQSLRIYESLQESDLTTDYDVDKSGALEGLATTYEHQGRVEEYRELTKRNYEEFGYHLNKYAKLMESEDPDRAERLWLQFLHEYRDVVSKEGNQASRSFFGSNLWKAARFMKKPVIASVQRSWSQKRTILPGLWSRIFRK